MLLSLVAELVKNHKEPLPEMSAPGPLAGCIRALGWVRRGVTFFEVRFRVWGGFLLVGPPTDDMRSQIWGREMVGGREKAVVDVEVGPVGRVGNPEGLSRLSAGLFLGQMRVERHAKRPTSEMTSAGGEYGVFRKPHLIQRSAKGGGRASRSLAGGMRRLTPPGAMAFRSWPRSSWLRKKRVSRGAE